MTEPKSTTESEDDKEVMFLPFDVAENLRRVERPRVVPLTPKQAEIQLRDSLIRNAHVATPDWRQARDEWLPMVEMGAGHIREGKALLITGATGMARTHIFNRLLCHRDLQPHGTDGLIRPLLLVQISSGDWRRPFPVDMLAALSARPGETAVPERFSGLSPEEVCSAVEAQIVAQQVQFVAAENIHGLRPASGKKDVEEAAETLGWLLLNRAWPVNILATACTDSDDMLIDYAPALRGKTIRVDTTPFIDLALIKEIAGQLHKKCGFTTPNLLFSTDKVAERLKEKSGGRPGLLIEIIKRAAKMAHLANRPSIEPVHLEAAERHVLPPGHAAKSWNAFQQQSKTKPTLWQRMRKK